MSVKKSFRHKINSHHFLAGGLFSCSILSPLFSVSAASVFQKHDAKYTCIHRENIENDSFVRSQSVQLTNGVSPPESARNSATFTSSAEILPCGEFNRSPFPLYTLIERKGEKDDTLLVQNSQVNDELVQLEPVIPEPTVSQLSDVKPTDWAYQALKALIERYGAISGYPDFTFRGARVLSRKEFAAALIVTLDNLDRLAINITDQYIKSDAVLVKRLQTEFADDLRELRLRTRLMEERVNRLEVQQFSPTTKLQGESIIAVTGGHQASGTVISRTRLNLRSSFRGDDLLVTQLQFGNNGIAPINKSQQENLNLLGTDGLIANGGGLDIVGVEPGVKLRRLYYSFRPWPDVEMVLGEKMSPRDFIDRNSYANNEAIDFSSSFFLNNPLIIQNQIDRPGGAGIAMTWHPQDSKLFWRSLYIGGDDDGLFGHTYQASVEMEYAPDHRFSLKLQYTNALVNNTDINALGLNAEYSLNRDIGIFTRLGSGSYQGFNTAISKDLDLNTFTWAVGLRLGNLFIPSTIAGVAVGQPFVSSKLGNATQTNFEIFYNLKLKENFSITPAFSLVVNPDGVRNQGTIWQTTLRTVISF
ncbi:hypothetical protein RintRC_2103 [Richelia intracellularis]|nr:hypothetical protein RintRC_2103 [Richelia intracellularis]